MGHRHQGIGTFGGLFRGRNLSDGDTYLPGHLVGKPFRRFRPDIIHPEFPHIQVGGDSRNLRPSLGPGTIETDYRFLLICDQVFQRHGRLGAGPQGRNQFAIHGCEKPPVPRVNQKDHPADIRQPFLGISFPAADELDSGAFLPAHESGHGIHPRPVRKTARPVAKIKVDLGRVDHVAFTHAPESLFHGIKNLRHGDQFLDLFLGQ